MKRFIYTRHYKLKPYSNLYVWNAKTYKSIVTIKDIDTEKPFESLIISNDNKQILASTYTYKNGENEQASIWVWDVSTGNLKRKIEDSKGKSRINQLSFNSMGNLLASFNQIDCTIDIWDYEKGVIINTLKTNKETLISFINNDEDFITFSKTDLATKIYNIKTGKEKLSIFILKDSTQWIATTPDGRFDGTPEAMKNFFVVKGLETYPLDNLFEQCYTPNLIGRIMNGEELPPLDIQLNQLKQEPLVKIVSPESSTTNSETATFTIEVTDQGGGIDEIRLYHNGKLIDVTQRGFKQVITSGTKETKTYTIQLVNGANHIKATAFNSQRTEGTPDEITIQYNGAKASSDMYILAIGINSYTNSRYSLNYAVNDASGFVNALKAGANCIFSTVNTTIINDAQATRAGILEAVEQIKAKIKPEDVFVFYYAGHGVMSSGSATDKPDFYLVPTDVTKMYEADDVLKTKGISAKEIGEFSKNIKAQKQLFVLDACQSGGAMLALASRGAAEEKAIAQLARSTGTYFIAASSTEQFATEVQELGHGVFTYSIIEAIKGACKSQDGKVTVNILKSCVEDKVPELTKKYKGEAQYPTGYGFGQDFPIVIVK